jgi:hypothetical protein
VAVVVDAVEQWEFVAEHVVDSVDPAAVVSEVVVELEAAVLVGPAVVALVDVVAVVSEVVVEQEAVASVEVVEAIKLSVCQMIKNTKSLFVNKQIRQQYMSTLFLIFS